MKTFSIMLFFALLSCVRANAVDVVTTFAGVYSHSSFYEDGFRATSTPFNVPNSAFVDSRGDLLIAEKSSYCIRKISNMTELVQTVVGTCGSSGSSGDNQPATNAKLNNPYSIFLDTADNMYIAESTGNRIRLVMNTTQGITTVAGTGTAGLDSSTSSLTATSAKLNNPCSVWVDSSRNIFIADTKNNLIRKVTFATGNITTMVGGGTVSSYANNTLATVIILNLPNAVFGDSMGYLYVADTNHYRIIKITPLLKVLYLIGTGSAGYNPNHNLPATSTPIQNVLSLFVTIIGDVIFSDAGNYLVRKYVAATNRVITIAGNHTGSSYNGDNIAATSAYLSSKIVGVFVTSFNDDVWIADAGAYRVRKVIATTKLITTVAGTGSITFAGDDGNRNNAWLYRPTKLWKDSNGLLYLADSANYRIRTIDTNNIIHTIAGIGTNNKPINHTPALLTSFGIIEGLFGDIWGNLYLSDTTYSIVYKLDNTTTTRYLHYLAGTGVAGYNGDNQPATVAQLNNPGGVFVDTTGIIYIADVSNNRIRQITTNGMIHTLIGTPYMYYYDYYGISTAALLNVPYDMWINTLGDVYIADTTNYVIRKITHTTGRLSVYAGIPATYSSVGIDNIPATSSKLGFAVYTIYGNSIGELYIGDSSRVRKISNSTGMISTVLGGGYDTSAQAIPATSLSLAGIRGIWIDTIGTLYVSDKSCIIQKLVYNSNMTTRYAGTRICVSNYTNNIPATSTSLNYPAGLWGDSNNQYLYLADTLSHQIKRISISTGILTIFLTNQKSLFGIWGDTIGYLYIPLYDEAKVYKVHLTISTANSTIAGTGVVGYNGDDIPATTAQLNQPQSIRGDTLGNLYLADTNNARIRQITLDNGMISTIAGSGTGYGAAGEGVTGTATQLYSPQSIWGDAKNGMLYIADSSNHAIRQYDSISTNVSTIAGMKGKSGNSGNNGPATSALLQAPYDIIGDSNSSKLYIVDYSASVIRTLNLINKNISLYAGTTSGYVNGIATEAQFDYPFGITIDNTNTVCIADYTNQVIRMIEPLAQTNEPSMIPSIMPTMISNIPSITPSIVPSIIPSITPSITPSMIPSIASTTMISHSPSITPSMIPSITPSLSSSSMIPSIVPTVTMLFPSSKPSTSPTTSSPTVTPTITTTNITSSSSSTTNDSTSSSILTNAGYLTAIVISIVVGMMIIVVGLFLMYQYQYKSQSNTNTNNVVMAMNDIEEASKNNNSKAEEEAITSVFH